MLTLQHLKLYISKTKFIFPPSSLYPPLSPSQLIDTLSSQFFGQKPSHHSLFHSLIQNEKKFCWLSLQNLSWTDNFSSPSLLVGCSKSPLFLVSIIAVASYLVSLFYSCTSAAWYQQSSQSEILKM